MLQQIVDKILAAERLTFAEGMELIDRADLLLLGSLADTMRRRLHPENIVTFVSDRNINYTNVCTCGCRFCAFYRGPHHSEAYILSQDEIFRKIEETIAAGGTQILMQGGLHPELDLKYYEELFRSIKERYPIHLHCLSPVEIYYLAQKEGLGYNEVITRLVQAGLGSIPGGGAEILVDSVRQKISPRKVSAAEWLEVMRTAHNLGLKTTATMVFGHSETTRDRLAHLEAIRCLQDETGGFTAFIPWSFQPGNTDLGGEEKTAVEYLKILALSRLYLDNIANIQVSWVTQGTKVGQIALSFGANDFGSTMLEENVVRAAGTHHRAAKSEIIKAIENAGQKAAQRNFKYDILQRF